MARSRVVLPQPDGPRKQTNSPFADIERDVAQGGEVAEALGEVADREVGRPPSSASHSGVDAHVSSAEGDAS